MKSLVEFNITIAKNLFAQVCLVLFIFALMPVIAEGAKLNLQKTTNCDLSYCGCIYTSTDPDTSESKLDNFLKPKNGSTYVIAHRGAHNGPPENSLAAYQKAINLGCDFVEIDVRTTKDSQFVSIHNSTVDKYADGVTGKVSDFTLAELRAFDIGIRIGPEWKNTQIPTFEEILQLCSGKIGIYLDLKDAPVARLVELINKYNMEEDIVWFVGMQEAIELINNCKKCIPMLDAETPEDISGILKNVNTPVLSSYAKYLNESYMKAARTQNVKIFADDSEDDPRKRAAQWNRMLDLGTDGIQTDYPEELIKLLHEREKRIK